MMRDVMGTQAKQNIQLNSDEVQVLFTDFTGMQRVIITSLNETLPILPMMQGTVPVLAM